MSFFQLASILCNSALTMSVMALIIMHTKQRRKIKILEIGVMTLIDGQKAILISKACDFKLNEHCISEPIMN